MMDNIFINFNKAYMIVPRQISIEDKNYRQYVQFTDFTIYFSNDLSSYEYTKNDIKVVILGHFVHTKHVDLKYPEICAQLLSHEIDSYDFLEEMSFYNGRYVMLIEYNGRLLLYNDATSFLSLYYHASHDLYASHSELVNQLVKLCFDKTCERIAHKSYGFLDYSKYKDVYKFNANTRFNITDHTIKRIYPIKPCVKKSAEEVYDIVNDEIEAAVEYLFQFNQKVICSITAGHDSKVSLSYIKEHINDVHFFTYTKNIDELEHEQAAHIYRTDEYISQKMAYNLNLKHTLFNMDQLAVNSNLIDRYQLYETDHSIYLINYYHENRSFNHCIHLKSTIFELAKSIIPKRIQRADSFLPYENAIKKWAKDFPVDQLSQDYLLEFINRNDLNKTIELGYHPYETLYYESRINGWHSCIVQESDDYLDVFSLINTRHILFEFMSINQEDKQNQMLHKLMIKHHWPILNYFQINEMNTLEDRLIQLEEDTNRDVESLAHVMIQTEDFYQVIQNEHKLFRALTPKFSYDNQKKMILTNTQDNTISLELRTFYHNKNGRDTVYFDIESESIDLVDLSKNNLELTIEPQASITISVYASKKIEKTSWISASQFELIEK